IAVDRKYGRKIVALDAFIAEEKSAAQRMCIVEPHAGVTLYSGAGTAAKNPRRDAVKRQVANCIGREEHARVALKQRDLVIYFVAQGALQRENAVAIDLPLLLVQLG